MKTLPVYSVVRLEWQEDGERPVAVLDFGPDCEGGYPAFTASGIKGAPVVRASYACHPGGLGDTGDFSHETRATYLGPEVDLPILPASTNRHDLFRITAPGRYEAPLQQGLVRYVRLTLDTPGTAVTITSFALENRGTHAIEPVVGAFNCTDASLAAIWRMSVRTCQLAAIPARTSPLTVQTANHGQVTLGPSRAYLSDGAKRDRLVWSGDLWWAQRNAYAAWDYDSPYIPESLRMLAENRTPEGYVQACPYPESRGPLADGDYGPFPSDEFAAWFVPVLWDHILHSGDRALAEELYPVARDLVAYLSRHCRADGLFEQRIETAKHASSLDFGESSTYHRAYINILLWKTYRDAASLAEWLGDGESAVDWRTVAESLAALIRRLFWDAGKGRFVGALETDEFQGEANGLALAARFCTDEEAAAIRRSIARHQHGKFQALFVRGLYEYGYADDAVARIYEHGWPKALDPSWEGPRLTSECMGLHTRGWGDEAHPDTAIAGILTNYVLGVEPTAPGFEKYTVRPRPSAGVTGASGVVPTPWGAIRVTWRMEDGKPVIDCREERHPITPSISFTSGRDPLSYDLGDEITFSIRARGGSRIRWKCLGDDGRESHGEVSCQPSAQMETLLPGEPLKVTTALDRPGFVRLRADLLDSAGKEVAHFDGGAGAAVDDIRPDNPEPPGFDEFWERRRAALAAIPMAGAECLEIKCEREGVRLYKVSIPCAGGRPSTGYLSIPKAEGRYPARVHFHGYNNSWSENAYRPPKNPPADAIFFDVSAHGFELDREPEYYTALRATCGSNGYDYAFDPVQNSDPEKAYFGGMTWRVMRALEYLKSRPEWDGKTLIVEGGSQGGLQSIWAATLDHDVTECQIFIPWCCNIGGPDSGRVRGDWHIEWVPTLGYYDPANMAKRIPSTCRVTISWAGLGDYICPPSGVMSFYNALKCPKSIMFVQGAEHTYYPPAPQQTSGRTTTVTCNAV